MRKTIAIALLLACAIYGHAQGTQKYVEQLRGTEELKESVWGIKAVRMDGTTIAEYNSGTRMLPASNAKLITTGLVLNEFGDSHRFSTSLRYDGVIKDGILEGDLYIVGGGDPTIGARDSISTPLVETFSAWEKLLREHGITRISGRIVGDGRFFDGETEHYSWQYEDIGSYYAPGGSALSFYENAQDFTITPTAVGEPAGVRLTYPETPWISFRNTAVTSKAGSGDNLFYVTTDLAPVGEMRGDVGADRRPFRLSGSNKFGEMTCAYYFYKYLEGKGIIADEGPADIDALGMLRNFSDDEDLPAAAVADSLKTLGSSMSPTVGEIVKKTNHESDNFYAEALLRQLSKAKTGSACYDSCEVAENAALKALGLGEGVQLVDGSGLSRKDYISPDFLVDFLKKMHGTKTFDSFLASLPQPGKGTLSTRMLSYPAADKSRIYMKSGSMNGVRCFSGYILSPDGKDEGMIVFSIMTNNTIVSSSRINFIMDKLMGLMALENKAVQ